jgi:RHS repeat-associated protein
VDAVDTGGAPTASTLRRYSAFGVPGQAAPAQSIERGFASRPIEGASGLVYMRARHYDPTTGRFLQPDPEGIASTQRYAFAEHNPYIYNDPTGRSSRGIGSLDRGVPSWAFEEYANLSQNDVQLASFPGAPDGPEAKTPGGAAADLFEGGRTYLDGVAKSRAEAGIMEEVAQRRADAVRIGGSQDKWTFVTEQNIVNRATGQRSFVDYRLGRNIPVAPGTPASNVPIPDSLTPFQGGIFQRTWTLRGPLFIYRAPGRGI